MSRAGEGRQVTTQPPAARWLTPLCILALVALAGAQILGFAISPPDRDMGHLQKIMYVHVPAAWNSFIAAFVLFIFSVVYLVRKQERHDLLAASAAQAGAVLTALTLALGSIWGRPTWGVWWTWDPRLTTTAVLMLLYVAYLALRAFTEDPERRARWSAAVGILTFLDVPIVYMSVRWRSIHQVQSSPATVDSAYALGLQVNGLAFLLLLIYLIAQRYHAARLERAAEARREEAALAHGGVHV
ncbi:MAG TPA: cytochrome c biogenesis protein CcsA [Longimicrobiales bacterium]